MDADRSYGVFCEPLRVYSYVCKRAADVVAASISPLTGMFVGSMPKNLAVGFAGITLAPCLAGAALGRGLRAVVWTATHFPGKWMVK